MAYKYDGQIFIKNAYCGKDFSFVEANNKVICFGLEENGKTGVGISNKAVVSPMVNQLLSSLRIKGIACSRTHCLAWDAKGKVYSWGEGNYG